jgi:hypothetical protein
MFVGMPSSESRFADLAQIYGPLRFFRTKFVHGALKFSESDDPMGSSTSTRVE